MARNFPTGPQDQFFYQPGQPYQGLMYGHDPRRDYLLSGYIRDVTEVGGEYELTVTWGVDDEGIGFIFSADGGPTITIPAAALTDDDTSAAALDTAIQAFITANPAGPLASASVATNVVTVVFTAGVLPSVPAAGFGTGTSSVAQAESVAPILDARLDYGLGVTLDPGGDFSVNGPNLRSITSAVSGTSTLLGVLALFPGEMNSAFTREALGFSPDYLIPNKAHPTVVRGRVIVPWVGTLPTGPTDQVFWINDPAVAADRGKFRSDVNGAEADLVSAFVEGVYADANLVAVFFDL